MAGGNVPDIQYLDCPINSGRHITAWNENILFVVTAFCEKQRMNQFMSRSPNRYAQAPADAAPWVELYFPNVDDSLQRRASAPRLPSLFEKPFSVIVSVTQLSQQPAQRQT
jgi:hypothetical protein